MMEFVLAWYNILYNATQNIIIQIQNVVFQIVTVLFKTLLDVSSLMAFRFMLNLCMYIRTYYDRQYEVQELLSNSNLEELTPVD